MTLAARIQRFFLGIKLRNHSNSKPRTATTMRPIGIERLTGYVLHTASRKSEDCEARQLLEAASSFPPKGVPKENCKWQQQRLVSVQVLCLVLAAAAAAAAALAALALSLIHISEPTRPRLI
eukprot:893721-Amphidinium_carterae.1